MLYLFDKKRGFKDFLFILESTDFKNQSLNILANKKIDNKEEVLSKFNSWISGNPDYKKYLPLLSFFYQPGKEKLLKDIFDDFLEIHNQLSIDVRRKSVVIRQGSKKEELLPDQLTRFGEIVHGLLSKKRFQKKKKEIQKTEKAGKFIVSKNNIEIYLANSPLDAAILGRGYPFCISKLGSPYFNEYRIQLGLTTYFIFDNNRDKNDPLHIVVYMIGEHGKILLTDALNITESIDHPYDQNKPRGNYVQEYKKYLLDNGIDPDKYLQHIPLDEKEREKYNQVINKVAQHGFASLSPEEMKIYISLGETIYDDELELLFDKAEKWYNFDYQEVLRQYFYSGFPLPEKLVSRINNIPLKGLLNHYLRHRVVVHNAHFDYDDSLLITEYEYPLLNKKQKWEMKVSARMIVHYLGSTDADKIYEALLSHKKIIYDPELVRVLNRMSPDKGEKLINHMEVDLQTIFDLIQELKNKELAKILLEKVEQHSPQHDSKRAYFMISNGKLDRIAGEDKDRIRRIVEKYLIIDFTKKYELFYLINLFGPEKLAEDIINRKPYLFYGEQYGSIAFISLLINIDNKFGDNDKKLKQFFEIIRERFDELIESYKDKLENENVAGMISHICKYDTKGKWTEVIGRSNHPLIEKEIINVFLNEQNKDCVFSLWDENTFARKWKKYEQEIGRDILLNASIVLQYVFEHRYYRLFDLLLQYVIKYNDSFYELIRLASKSKEMYYLILKNLLATGNAKITKKFSEVLLKFVGTDDAFSEMYLQLMQMIKNKYGTINRDNFSFDIHHDCDTPLFRNFVEKMGNQLIKLAASSDVPELHNCLAVLVTKHKFFHSYFDLFLNYLEKWNLSSYYWSILCYRAIQYNRWDFFEKLAKHPRKQEIWKYFKEYLWANKFMSNYWDKIANLMLIKEN